MHIQGRWKVQKSSGALICNLLAIPNSVSFSCFQFNIFLDSWAEIHQIFALFFLENLIDQKVILKLTYL